ncbi:DUF1501 domain-containing protein [Cupriavidus basilensis]|uniref:DUF1501 domain-containing protein n=1 Tax=Cupriavidus basilensis TaxID=68895 RepID=UPI00157B5788|nr:DUF1501 domain-containing protein [Cupriavidus basilensis]NUA25697.1 DUF1501 domain-containing protein [Cupriavidus basilensis]
MFSRRDFLRVTGGAAAMLALPRLTLASVDSDRRFVFVIQRGAADGLNTVIPYADPGYARLRGALAIDAAQATKLDGTFALHPALTETARMYTAGQALFVQAVASPYRERSHFDGQNVLETGGAAPYQVKDGWMNRLVSLLPKRPENAIAFAPTVPAALRGPVEVGSYAPSALPSAPDDLLTRVGQLYEMDPLLHPLWNAAMQARGLAGDAGARQDPASLGRLAAGFLARADGPRIAMIETGGWDTHSAQAPRLAARLKALDTMLAALRDGLGPSWERTTVLVATEFGRTAAANGTGGTDHGTGAAAMLLGGGVKGGRVLADWPGLAQGALYQGRDLAPTTELDGLIAAAAAQSFGLDGERVARTLFGRGRGDGGGQGGMLGGLLRA